MRTSFLALLLGLGLAGCGSGSTTANPDPRAATIRQQHQQLLAKQKEAATLALPLDSLKIRDSQRAFDELVQSSQANLTNLDQLDPAKSHEADQVALMAKMAADEKNIIDLADNDLWLVRNYLVQLDRRKEQERFRATHKSKP